MLVIENCNSLSELRQKFIDGEEVRTARYEPCEDWYDVPSDEMTLEQARQAVKDLRKKLAEYLEQESYVDAISRQAACDAIRKYKSVVSEPDAYDKAFDDGIDTAIAEIGHNVPPVKLQEPCDDVISRQAVLDAIDVKAWEFCDYLISKNRNDEQKPVSHFADNLRECVREELPSVKPQPKTGHWIPVSEKLPDKEGYYLCSVRYMYPPYNFFEPEKVKYMDDVTIQKFDGEFNIEVKAWMPLPPCYKPQESEE